MIVQQYRFKVSAVDPSTGKHHDCAKRFTEDGADRIVCKLKAMHPTWFVFKERIQEDSNIPVYKLEIPI